LHRHAFAHAAKPAEIVLREQLEIPGNRLAALVERITGGGHSRLRGLVMRKGRREMRRPGCYNIRPSPSPGSPALACLRNSVRSALVQSGTALILFSLSRISDCSCM